MPLAPLLEPSPQGVRTQRPLHRPYVALSSKEFQPGIRLVSFILEHDMTSQYGVMLHQFGFVPMNDVHK